MIRVMGIVRRQDEMIGSKYDGTFGVELLVVPQDDTVKPVLHEMTLRRTSQLFDIASL